MMQLKFFRLFFATPLDKTTDLVYSIEVYFIFTVNRGKSYSVLRLVAACVTDAPADNSPPDSTGKRGEKRRKTGI